MLPDDPEANGPDTLVTGGRQRSTPEAGDETIMLQGYSFGEVIGRGGVGEVQLAHDLRIGRDVAIKRLRAAAPTAEQAARFLREARIQARLDHPAIPPVYELGRDSHERPYFTMKRLAGATLRDLLAAPAPNRPALLRAFVDVCLAIEFAHSRGVVHRDLKPSNIMLGDFGDVYVLDWGLARVVGEAVAEVVTDDIDSLELKAGDVLGTPGYMAPEQLQQAALAGRAADVYALGAILFEILAGESLHPRGAEALPSTISNKAVTSPGKRRADRAVPPELDALCAAALVMEPTARPTARRIAERIQGYLDGDRDVARRRTIAVDLVWSARAAYNEGRRAEAIRAAGRALALDPESPEAGELVTALMLEPPAEPPSELVTAQRDADADAVRRHARTAIFAYLALASFMPLSAIGGVMRWDIVGAIFGVALVMIGAAWRIYRQPVRSHAQMTLYAVGNMVLLGLLCRMSGPFSFAPALACVLAMSVMAYPTFIERPWILLGLLSLGFLVPLAGEAAGYLTKTWSIRDGELISHAGVLKLGGASGGMLIGATLATFLVAGVHACRIYRTSRNAQMQLVTQAWHLRQLLPAAASSLRGRAMI